MISVVYDVHLIGDYTLDNRDFDGVQDRASQLLEFLSQEFPSFLKNAQNGSLARCFARKSIRFQ